MAFYRVSNGGTPGFDEVLACCLISGYLSVALYLNGNVSIHSSSSDSGAGKHIRYQVSGGYPNPITVSVYAVDTGYYQINNGTPVKCYASALISSFTLTSSTSTQSVIWKASDN